MWHVPCKATAVVLQATCHMHCFPGHTLKVLFGVKACSCLVPTMKVLCAAKNGPICFPAQRQMLPVAPGAARWLPVPPPPEAPRPVMQAPGSGRPAAELLGGFAESKVFCRPGLRQVLGGRSGMRVYTGCSPTAGHYDGLPTSGANRPWKWANPGWPHF